MGLAMSRLPRLSAGRIIASALVLLLVGFLVYGNALKGQFVLDDDYLVRDNPMIRSWANIPASFRQDIGAGTEKRSDFYRPLQIVSYIADFSFFKLRPFGYHLTNILVHVAASALLGWIVFLLFGLFPLAFLTSLLFLVHPVHTEAVTYISGRSDPLAMFFLLLTLILYLRRCERPRPALLTAMALTYAAALLSREGSIILPALVFVLHKTLGRKADRAGFVLLVALAFLYVIMRVTLIKSLVGETAHATTLFARLPGVFVALSAYFKLLVWPSGLHMEYGRQTFSFADPRVWLGSAVTIGLLVLAGREKRRHPMVSFGICWFFVSLAPFLNLYPINAYMAEHWLYLPSVGFFLLMAAALVVLWKRQAWRPLAIGLGAWFLIFNAAATVRQNQTWLDPVVFYERTLRYAPRSTTALINLANAYTDRGRPAEAVPLYEKAIGIDPKLAEPYNNMGNAYQMLGLPQKATPLYQKALEVNPKFPRAYYNLGKTYHLAGETSKALPLYEKAVAYDPYYVPALNNLGLAYAESGDLRRAQEMFERALRLNPSYATACYNLGNLYRGQGDRMRARQMYERALKIDPGLESVRRELDLLSR